MIPRACPSCGADTRGTKGVCWMCRRPIAELPAARTKSDGALDPALEAWAAPQRFSTGADTLWLLGVICTGALALSIVAGLLLSAPGLAVLFALVALPVWVVLLRTVQRERSGEGNDPLIKGIAASILVLSTAIAALLLLFVAAIVLFFILCMALGGGPRF